MSDQEGGAGQEAAGAGEEAAATAGPRGPDAGEEGGRGVQPVLWSDAADPRVDLAGGVGLRRRDAGVFRGRAPRRARRP